MQCIPAFAPAGAITHPLHQRVARYVVTTARSLAVVGFDKDTTHEQWPALAVVVNEFILDDWASSQPRVSGHVVEIVIDGEA